MTRTNLDQNHVGPMTLQEGAFHWGMPVNAFDKLVTLHKIPTTQGTNELMCEFQFVLLCLGKPKAPDWRQSPPEGPDNDAFRKKG